MRHDTCNFRNTALAASALAFALSASAAVPVRWDADAYRVKTLVYDCYHGETLDLAATLTAYGDPIDLAGKTARLWWQTNGMDAAWWATNAEVRVDAATGATNVLAATWRGSFDTGADEVRGFIGVEGENYRAAFALRLRPSPGFAPSVLPIPVRTIDWGAVENERADLAPFALKGGAGGGVTATEATNIAARVVTNGVAPWALAGQARPVADLTAATNYTDTATAALSNATAVALATAATAATNYTDAAIASIDRTRITDGTNAVYATLDATVSVPGRWNPQGYVVDGSTMYTNINWYSLPSGSGYWRRDVYTWMSGEWNLESTNTPMSDGEHPAATDPDATTLYFVRNDEASKTEYIQPTTAQTRIATTNDLIEANRYTDAATNALGESVAALSNATASALSTIDTRKLDATNPAGTQSVYWEGDILTFTYGISVGIPSMFPEAYGVYFGGFTLQSLLDAKADESAVPTAATNAAEAVFAANADYALTNLTANATNLTLQSGTIANLALDAATTNLFVTLAYPPANDRSCDALIRLVCESNTALAVANDRTAVDGTGWDTIKAGTNIIMFTRVAYVNDATSIVQVAVKEVK